MFSVVNKGALIYVLDKRGETPLLRQGVVADAVKLQPMLTQYGVQTDVNMKLVLDMGGGDTMELTDLPGSQNTFTYPDGKVTVSESHDAMQGIISSLKKQSDDIVSGYERNKELSGVYNDMLMDLNPEYRKNEERDRELQSLKSDVKEMKSMFKQWLEANTSGSRSKGKE